MITGLNSIAGLQVAQATEANSREIIRSSAQHARAIEHFRENIAAVETVDDLMGDPELYGFVMRAFDLEAQIPGKALMKKMFESDISDTSALVNRLTDPRFREIYKALDFGPDGVGTTNTLSQSWQDWMVDRYVTRQFLDARESENETVGRALYFREQAGGIETAFDILKDKDVAKVLRTAFGIPEATVGLDIDKQAELLLEKIDLETLSDPDEVTKIMQRYVAIADALSGAGAAQNTAVQLLQPRGSFAPVTFDFEMLSAVPQNPYR
ncbi:DUF1217 domain-containing protein [Roseivivax sp. GX 12232]|uniref:DUF1217 domain-containing protein n=1 Tax=Roseivivax sp. GX 12232 TaxID=2900547 RepID=UPI001E446CE6|nr:DUF1217 domain-containing protein [Roseivivax sp. GX 12232]